MNSVEKLADSTTMESYIVVLYRNPWYYLAAAVCAITCTRPIQQDGSVQNESVQSHIVGTHGVKHWFGTDDVPRRKYRNSAHAIMQFLKFTEILTT